MDHVEGDDLVLGGVARTALCPGVVRALTVRRPLPHVAHASPFPHRHPLPQAYVKSRGEFLLLSSPLTLTAAVAAEAESRRVT